MRILELFKQQKKALKKEKRKSSFSVLPNSDDPGDDPNQVPPASPLPPPGILPPTKAAPPPDATASDSKPSQNGSHTESFVAGNSDADNPQKLGKLQDLSLANESGNTSASATKFKTKKRASGNSNTASLATHSPSPAEQTLPPGIGANGTSGTLPSSALPPPPPGMTSSSLQAAPPGLGQFRSQSQQKPYQQQATPQSVPNASLSRKPQLAEGGGGPPVLLPQRRTPTMSQQLYPPKELPQNPRAEALAPNGNPAPNTPTPPARHFHVAPNSNLAHVVTQAYYGLLTQGLIHDLKLYYAPSAAKSLTVGGAHAICHSTHDVELQLQSLTGMVVQIRGVLQQSTSAAGIGGSSGVLVVITGLCIQPHALPFCHSLILVPSTTSRATATNGSSTSTSTLGYQIQNDALCFLTSADVGGAASPTDQAANSGANVNGTHHP